MCVWIAGSKGAHPRQTKVAGPTRSWATSFCNAENASGRKMRNVRIVDPGQVDFAVIREVKHDH